MRFFCLLQEIPEGQDALRPPSLTGSPEAITGTMLYAPYSVLNGGPHTVSSQLEGLFISLLGVSCNGRIRGRDLANVGDRNSWIAHRLAQFSSVRGIFLHNAQIAPHLEPLVTRLHALFWKLEEGGSQRLFQSNVNAADFIKVCELFGASRDAPL
jgi:hypothetical protein